MVDPTNRRAFLGGSGLAIVGLSGCLGRYSTESETDSSNTEPADGENHDRTLQWGGQGGEHAMQDCPGERGYWKWVLTPGGPTAIEAGAVLTVEFEDGSSETVDGYFPGGGQGAVHFDVFRDDGGTVESATVAFSGGGNNALLTISEGYCVEGPEDPEEPEDPDDPEDPEDPEEPDDPEEPEDPEDPDEPTKKEQKKKEAKKNSN